MSAEIDLTLLTHRRTYQLPCGIRIELVLDLGGIVCSWDPEMPKKPTARLVRAWRTALDDFLRNLAQLTPAPLLDLEIDHDGGPNPHLRITVIDLKRGDGR